MQCAEGRGECGGVKGYALYAEGRGGHMLSVRAVGDDAQYDGAAGGGEHCAIGAGVHALKAVGAGECALCAGGCG